jgi:excisionase family DNA binding protein
MSDQKSTKELTVKEFAEELNVSHDMITEWLHAGKIKGRRRNPFAKQSAFLIPESELDRVKKLMETTN